MIFCDLCGESKECLQKEIDGAEYDICADCWHPLADKPERKAVARRIGRRCFFRGPLCRNMSLKGQSRFRKGGRSLWRGRTHGGRYCCGFRPAIPMTVTPAAMMSTATGLGTANDFSRLTARGVFLRCSLSE
jgi:hypothetical protein